MKPTIAALLAMLLTACPAKTPVVDPGPEPTGSASIAPSPAPTPTKRGTPSAVRAAYIGEDGLFLYDVKTDTVQHLVQGQGIKQPRFLNRDTIAFVRDEGTGSAIVSYDVRTRALTTLHTSEAQINTWAPRPDNQEIAYIVTDANRYPQVRYRALVGNRTTLVVTTLARAFGREADLADQASIQWSPDGRRTLIVFTPADGEGLPVPDTAAQLQVRASDGALEFAPPQRQEATQAVLSVDGRKVYLRSTRGARLWDAATGGTAPVPGRPPAWFNLTRSPDGRALAYDTGATSMKARVETLDLRTGTRTQVGRAGRVHPVYANLRTVWTQALQPCEPECLYPVMPGPTVYATDLRTGVERTLKLPTLQDIAVFSA